MTRAPEDDLAKVERAVNRAQASGAEDAEVYLWAARSWETREAGAIRSVQEADESGVSVRVRVDGRRATVTTSGTREEDIEWAIGRAVQLARLMPKSATPWKLPEPEVSVRAPTKVDAGLVEPSHDRLLSTVEDAVDALAREPGLDYTSATVVTHEGRFVVGNTRGVLAWDRNAHEAFASEVRAVGQGESRTMRIVFQERREIGRAHDLKAAVARAAKLAREGGGALPLASAVHEIILDAPCAAQLLTGILPSFAGHAANEERSRFATRIGERVASEGLTLVDDPTDGAGVRNHRVDDLGTPTTGPLDLIRDGVLTNHVHDVASAETAGRPATGHGLRPLNGRYATSPKTRVANAVVTPGDSTLEGLVEGCERGVLLQGGLLGSFTMNALTGDLSCTAPLATLVERGRAVGPLRPVALGGNVFEALQDLRAFGRDLWRSPRGAFPALRLGGLSATT